MEKFRKWFNSNRPVICITSFLISIILSCFNLFKGLHDVTLTFITIIVLGFGCGVMIYDIYDIRKNKND